MITKPTALNAAEVAEIRSKYKTGKYTHVRLSKIYGVSRGTISNALKPTYRSNRESDG